MNATENKCATCGASYDPINSYNSKWCEDCFDKGLHKDMKEHFDNFVKQEMCAMCEIEKDGYSDEKWSAAGCPNHTCEEMEQISNSLEMTIPVESNATSASTIYMPFDGARTRYPWETEEEFRENCRPLNREERRKRK